MNYVPVELIEVRAWGATVGALAFDGRVPTFEYDPAWVRGQIELSPLLMPNRNRTRIYRFPTLNPDTYHGLPPLLADSLPDRFGNALIDAWMARQGVNPAAITALDRLAYLGNRGMGALEFVPDTAHTQRVPTALELGELVIAARRAVTGQLAHGDEEAEAALRGIIQVGTSAGGARAKAVVHVHPDTGELRSGQLPLPDGFEAWLLKFDGMGQDSELGTSGGYGRIEYAYSLMAREAGIALPETRLLEEHGRAHFMVRRFDRPEPGRKVQFQSLCGLAALDYNLVATHDYAQLFSAIEALGLGEDAKQQAFRRMAFNVAATNCDDHTKNHAFVLTEDGHWGLAPAYDITYAYNPVGKWTSQHLMSVNGKFRDVTVADFLAVADQFQIPGARAILRQVDAAVADWPRFAAEAGVAEETMVQIQREHQSVAAR